MTTICGFEIHPAADIFPMMEEGELRKLALDIQHHGQREAVVRWGEGGPVIDGRNRLRACEMAGVTPETWEVEPGDVGDPVDYVLSLNLHRRHLTYEQCLKVADKVATWKAGENQHTEEGRQKCRTSVPQAAKALGVSERGIRQYRKVQKDGTPELIAAVDRGQIAVSLAAEVAKEPPEVQREVVARGPKVIHNSGNNEWYTPAHIIEAAREVMGGIDLDPASCEEANAIVKAKRFFTKDDDGLAKKWRGRIWMNPPFSSDLVGKFAEKAASEYGAGHIREMIILVHNCNETKWYDRLFAFVTAGCFLRGRLNFTPSSGADEKRSGALQGQTVLYYGERPEAFFEVFGRLGNLWRNANDEARHDD